MATPCNPELAESPFLTFRDPQTGEWQVASPSAEKKSAPKNVLPFRRPTAIALPEQKEN